MKIFLLLFTYLLCWQNAICQPAKNNNAAKGKAWMQQIQSTDIVYKKVEGDELYLTLLKPTANRFKKMPVMIFIHGGGWRNGSRQAVFARTTGESVQQILDAGIAVATIDYRLVKEGGPNIYDCMVDCKDAARYLVKEADRYNIDTARIGVWGSSAGGHLALMTALGKNEDFLGDETLRSFNPTFKCVVAYYPLTTFIHFDIQAKPDNQNMQRFETLFSGPFADKQPLAKLASPVEYIDPSNPPILLVHGDKDNTASVKNSLLMKELAEKKQSNIQLIIVKGSGHGFKEENINPSVSEINTAATAFILKGLL